MMYLVDTNVVSELRKPPVARSTIRHRKSERPRLGKQRSAGDNVSLRHLHSRIGDWSPANGTSRSAAGSQSALWINDHVLPNFAGRILPVDMPVALRCASLHVPNPRPRRDALIACDGFGS